ncbi:MAG: hypothetical protein ACODAQ_04195, partial [Phycisphaeraceae bacterium]
GPDGTQPTERMVTELRRLVERGRRRWRLLVLAEAVSLAIAAPLAYMWLVFLIDNVYHLPTWGLLLANVVFFACLIWVGWRLVRSWKRARFTTDQVALAMEQRTPGGVQNRLINSLQLSRSDDAQVRAMTDAVVSENYRFLEQVQLQQIAESRPVVMRAIVAVLLVVMGAGFWVASAERFTTSASRLFMPFAGIDPVYRTRLEVVPGDVTIAAGEDVTVQVQLSGHIPDDVLLLIEKGDEQMSRRVSVDRAAATASYTFESVRRSTNYALRGGDFTTRQYRITVPAALEVRRLEAALRFPDYTAMEPRTFESETGDLEAVTGTEAALRFTLNQPVASAWLMVREPGDNEDDASSEAEKLTLRKADDATFTLDHTFDRTLHYTLTARRDGEDVRGPTGRLRAVPDEEPEVYLGGVEADSAVMIEDVLELRVRGRDDYGLRELGLFYRQVHETGDEASKGEWRAIETWPLMEAESEASGDPIKQDQREVALLLGMLPVAEGDVLELAARARDMNPERGDAWTTSTTYPITVTSPGATLQLTYERILETERTIRELIAAHDKLEATADEWVRKLEPGSSLRWDEQKNLDALAKAMRGQASRQAELRQRTGEAARDMPTEAGQTLRSALAMLADTEMVRHIRILERVPERDTPQAKRSTLSDARLTVRRTVRSLSEILDDYIRFREDWELSHMVSFTQMLAQRQARLADATQAYTAMAADAIAPEQRASIKRRQMKVHELSGLTGTAFEGLARREDEIGPILTDAFTEAAAGFAESGLKKDMTEAAAHLEQAAWSQAEPKQRAAGKKLGTIYQNLRDAQSELARQAIAELEELAETSELAKQELEKLREGFEKGVIAMEDDLSLADTLRLVEKNEEIGKQSDADREGKGPERMSYEDVMDELSKPRPGEVDTSTHTLADRFGAEGETILDETPDNTRNPGQTVVQEDLEDVVGELLEGTEELKEDYLSYTATLSAAVLDTGSDVSRKTPEMLNSTGATSTTGNQPPPSDDIGGAARAGRLGARAHGQVVGDHMINRRGRAAQEGQEDIPDQAGTMQETLSDDPQRDESTGTGGKRIDSDDTHFSTKDAGEWKDDIADDMEEPQDTHKIVERQGKPLDPEIADRMHDTENRQEQMIERIKTVKKEFDELYLPTDHLDDLMSQLESNFDRLREAPDAGVFREQVELLNELQSTVIVMHRPGSQFMQSVRREQRVDGRILDEKAALPLPGYEDAVDRYYRALLDLEPAVAGDVEATQP